MSDSSWRVVIAPTGENQRMRGAVFTVRAATADEAGTYIGQAWLWPKWPDYEITVIERVKSGDNRASYPNPGNFKPDIELIQKHVAAVRHYVNGRRLMPYDTDLRSYHALSHRKTPRTYDNATEDGHTHVNPRHIQEESWHIT